VIANPTEAPSEDDVLLASAARFLIDGHEEEAASLLLSCNLEKHGSPDTWISGDETIYAMHISLSGPRRAYEILRHKDHAITKSIRAAIEALLPDDEYIKHFTARAELVDIDSEWRSQFLEIVKGKGIHNQGVNALAVTTWKNLRFRSQSEVRIAASLEKAGIAFWPNCIARLPFNDGARNREADFLICRNGKFGILEVDGEPFHPASRTAQEHERDRLFKLHGVRVVEHFDASECFENADMVVKRFLDILARS
jgi:hypothetical protein